MMSSLPSSILKIIKVSLDELGFGLQCQLLSLSSRFFLFGFFNVFLSV